MEIRVGQEQPVTWKKEQQALSKNNNNNEGNHLLNSSYVQST